MTIVFKIKKREITAQLSFARKTAVSHGSSATQKEREIAPLKNVQMQMIVRL
jgi:hypothetical protein